MRTDTPPAGVPGSTVSRRARGPLVASLALAIVAPALAGHGNDSSTVDPSREDFRVTSIAPSPNGRWAALSFHLEDENERGVWLVDLSGGQPGRVVGDDIPLGDEEPAWRADGHLAIGRHRVDPSTAAVVPGRIRDDEESGWARRTVRKKSRDAVQWRIDWEGHEGFVELVLAPSDEIAITSLEGVVFYSERERDVVRIHRHDLATGRTHEVHAIESGSRTWSVSPDGAAIAVLDDTRLRIVGADRGEALAGPWAGGQLLWLEESGSRYAQLSRGGHEHLLDLVLDRRFHLGPTGARAHALADGRFLIHRADGHVELWDEHGELVRSLVPADGVLETAAR